MSRNESIQMKINKKVIYLNENCVEDLKYNRQCSHAGVTLLSCIHEKRRILSRRIARRLELLRRRYVKRNLFLRVCIHIVNYCVEIS